MAKCRWADAVQKVLEVRDQLLPWEPLVAGKSGRIMSRSLLGKEDECLLAMRARRGGTQSMWVLYSEHEGYFLTGGIEDSPEKAMAAADRALATIDPNLPLPMTDELKYNLGFIGDMLDEVEQPIMPGV